MRYPKAKQTHVLVPSASASFTKPGAFSRKRDFSTLVSTQPVLCVPRGTDEMASAAERSPLSLHPEIVVAHLYRSPVQMPTSNGSVIRLVNVIPGPLTSLTVCLCVWLFVCLFCVCPC